MNYRRTRFAVLLSAALWGVAAMAPVQAEVRIGFMAPLTGPLGITGQEVRRGFDLALEHLGGKLGGQEVVVASANDQASPTTAVSEFTRLVERERISILMGLAASNVALAVAPAAAKADVTVLMTHAGPDALAGKGCQANIFALGHQNEQFAYAMGSYLKQQGLNKVYFMGLDFQAGWEMLEALQQGLGQPVAGKSLTAMNQVDFAPELAKARDAYTATGLPSVADDSGLEVDALNGMPGVLSARWSGRHGDDAANTALLLAQLRDVPDERRGAAFSSRAVPLSNCLARSMPLPSTRPARSPRASRASRRSCLPPASTAKTCWRWQSRLKARAIIRSRRR